MDVNDGSLIKELDVFNSKAIYEVKFNPEEL